MLVLVGIFIVLALGLALWKPDEESVSAEIRAGFLTAIPLGLLMILAEKVLQRLGYEEYARGRATYLAIVTLFFIAVTILPKRWMRFVWRQLERRPLMARHSETGKRAIMAALSAMLLGISVPYIVLQARAVRSCQVIFAAARSANDSLEASAVITEAASRFTRFAISSRQDDCGRLLRPE